MDELKKLFVFGASGHAKVVIDVLEKAGIYQIAFVVDDNPHLKGREIFGYKVLGDRHDLLTNRGSTSVDCGIVAIGDNSARADLANWLMENGFSPATAVHPSAQIARGVRIGDYTVVMAGAIVNSDTEIRSSVIINTAASVDHDCIVGDAVHIAPGCRVCGNVTIGSRTFVGAGTTIVHGVSIGTNSVIGAGSVVIEDVPANVVAAGIPTRIIRTMADKIRV